MTIVVVDRAELAALADVVEGAMCDDVGHAVRAACEAGASGVGGSGLAGALSQVGGLGGTHADGLVRSVQGWARAVRAGGEGFAGADRAAASLRPV